MNLSNTTMAAFTLGFIAGEVLRLGRALFDRWRWQRRRAAAEKRMATCKHVRIVGEHDTKVCLDCWAIALQLAPGQIEWAPGFVPPKAP